MDTSFQRLARRQLSQALAQYAQAYRAPRPRDGWITALREALGMTVRQLAARLDVSPSSVSRLEQRERDDTITLGALRRAADALDCDLVYAVVPRRAVASESDDNLLDSIIETRAREVAEAEISRIAHTMALEDQAVSSRAVQAQVSERAAALAETPRRLWEPTVVPSGAPHATKRRSRSE